MTLSSTPTTMVTRRLWLTFPIAIAQEPIINTISKKHQLSFDIRHASMNQEIGLMGIVIHGEQLKIDSAIEEMTARGIVASPIEIGVFD